MRYTLRNQPIEYKEYVTIDGIEAEYSIRILEDKIIVIAPYLKVLKTVNVIAFKQFVIEEPNTIDIIKYMLNTETFTATKINTLLNRI
jgi:hypothetical protein